MITPRLTSSIDKHFNELNKKQVLSIQEQEILGYRALSGCTEAREELISTNLRLVITLANRYMRQGVAYEDIVAAGNEGLVQSVATFDPAKGNFPSWAYSYITRQILAFLSSNQHTIKITHYHKKLGHTPTKIKYFSEFELGLDDYSVEDTLPGSTEQEEAQDRNDENTNLKEVLQLNISKLRTKYQRAIQLHFFDGLGREDVAKEMGVTRQRVDQIIKNGLGELKELISIPTRKENENNRSKH